MESSFAWNLASPPLNLASPPWSPASSAGPPRPPRPPGATKAIWGHGSGLVEPSACKLKLHYFCCGEPTFQIGFFPPATRHLYQAPWDPSTLKNPVKPAIGRVGTGLATAFAYLRISPMTHGTPEFQPHPFIDPAGPVFPYLGMLSWGPSGPPGPPKRP